MIDFARARKQMVDTQLRTSSITDRRLLAAMGQLPRERFVPESRRDLAYIDADIPLGPSGRALSAAAPFARLVQLANIRPEDTVLDLGCGTGYSTAVLAALGKSVLAIETDAGLAQIARANLRDLGIENASVELGGLNGIGLSGGPFDVVVLEAAVSAVPEPLWDLLRERGRLVALVGSGMSALAHLFIRTGREIAGRTDFNGRMPPLDPAARSGDFVF